MMKKERMIVLAMTALGTMAVSCSKSGLETPPLPPEPNGMPVEVSLTVAPQQTPAAASRRAAAIDTRTGAKNALTVDYGFPDSKAAAALTSDDEQQVNDLWVIQFDKAAGTLVGRPYYAGPEQIARTGAAVNFEARLTTASTAQTVYFVANTNSPSTFTAANCGTVADMEAVCRRVGTEFKPTAAGGLPMLAVREYPSIASGTPLTGAVLRRLAAKVVFRCKVSSAFAGFTLTGVRLRNVPAAIWYAAEKTGAVDFPAKNTAYGDESHLDYPAEDLTKAETDGDYLKFTWYVPENLRRAVTTVTDERDRVPANTDGMATYIEVTGDFKSPLRCERLSYRIPLGDAAGDVNDYNVRRNTVYTATAAIEGRNAADKRVEAGTFDLNNCGMVVPNSREAGAVTFDIRKLTNGWQTAMPALGAGAALRAELLWTDNQALVSQLGITLDKVNGLLTVKSTGTATGNAVVALYDNAAAGSGQVLWSWHVWVTDYRPDGGREYGLAADSKAAVAGGEVHTYGTNFMATNPGKVIMDRNLGATAALYALSTTNAQNYPTYGLFYQWGRKDPFPKAAAEAAGDDIAAQVTYNAAGGVTGYPVLTQGPVAFSRAVQNPQAYYYHSSYTDWVDPQDRTFWGDGTTKSVYDPCPQGWRVAPKGTWDDFTVATFATNADWTAGDADRAGRLYAGANGVKAFYPAAGYRLQPDGTLDRVSCNGYSWSSTTTDYDAWCMSFSPSAVFPGIQYQRASGMQVRCIQE